MPVPEWLLNIQNWIVTLSPIITCLVLILYKPGKAFFISVFKHFVQDPDSENRTEIDRLEERLNRLDENIEQIMEYRETNKEIYIALLHHEIFQTARRCLEKETITEQELENLEELYLPYKKLGGNGTAEKLYNDCTALPLNHGDKKEET